MHMGIFTIYIFEEKCFLATNYSDRFNSGPPNSMPFTINAWIFLSACELILYPKNHEIGEDK